MSDRIIPERRIPERRTSRIPALRATDLHPSEYARSICFTAGHLVTSNAGWRNVRPVIDEDACTGCLQCYMYCPDGTVFKTGGGAGHAAVAIDYAFCKGCGICAKLCAFGAIDMVSEREALAAEAAGAFSGAACSNADAQGVSAALDSDEESEAGI